VAAAECLVPSSRRHPGLFPAIVSFSLVYREDGSERTLDLVCKARDKRWRGPK